MQPDVGADDEAVGSPGELGVGVDEPLVGPHAVGEQHESEREGGADHGLAPGEGGVGGTGLGLPEHDEGAHEDADGGPDEGLVRTLVLDDQYPDLETDEEGDHSTHGLEEVVDRNVYGPTGHIASWIMLVNGCTRSVYLARP